MIRETLLKFSESVIYILILKDSNVPILLTDWYILFSGLQKLVDPFYMQTSYWIIIF